MIGRRLGFQGFLGGIFFKARVHAIIFLRRVFLAMNNYTPQQYILTI